MIAVCRGDGIRDRDHTAFKSHRASVAVLTTQWQEDSGGEKEHKYLPRIRMPLGQRDECTDLKARGGAKSEVAVE